VATELGWSQSKLSRAETSVNRLTESDLARLLAVYQVDEVERERLTAIADDQPKRRRGPPTIGIPEVYGRFLELEREATTISTFSLILISGLFQTPEYAGALFKSTPVPETHLERERLAARIGRQAVLAHVPPPQVRVVIDESVLRRPVGGKDVMRRQMLRLLEASEVPTVTVQVLPLAIGAHPGLSEQFTMLEFAGPAERAAVFCDGLVGGVMWTQPNDVERYRDCFEALTRLALSPEESARMIARQATPT
jgi:hypothetical protein